MRLYLKANHLLLVDGKEAIDDIEVYQNSNKDASLTSLTS